MPRQANRSKSIRQIARQELFLQISSLDSKQSFHARCDGIMLIPSRCKPAEIICRHCARFSNNANAASGFDKRCRSIGVMECWSNEMNSSSNSPLLHYSVTPALLLAAEEFHDIAPPVDYSLVPPWLVFVIAFVALSLLGLVVWWFAQRRKPELPPKAPREIALEELEQIRAEIERMTPYQFSIRVSDILRRYVTQQYGLPAMRQTSIEFLNASAKAPSFSADDKSLLEDFLNRCDLIKFAKYQATTSDSELLLEEAMRFVKGGQLATV